MFVKESLFIYIFIKVYSKYLYLCTHYKKVILLNLCENSSQTKICHQNVLYPLNKCFINSQGLN